MLGGPIPVTQKVKSVSKLPEEGQISVDWLLDNVDLTFQGYIPSAIAIEFFNFIRLSLGEEPENSNPLAHYFLVDTIFMQPNVEEYFKVRGIDYDEYKGRTVVLCCREFAKSTLIGTFIPLYMAWKGELPGFGRVNYGLYVGDSMTNNVQTTMRTIESVFNESEWLQTQFESTRFTDAIIELVRHPRTPKEVRAYKNALDMGKKPVQVPGRSKRKFAMKGVGAQTGTRGTRSGLQRPQFAILDDLVPSEADASSEAVMKNINTTIDSDVLNALHGAGNFAILIGTPYNKVDPVYSRAESKGWVPIVFPICEGIHEDMEFKDFTSVWSDRHSFSAVMRRYKQSMNDNSIRSFNQELMLRITNDKDKVVDENWIIPFDIEDVLRKGNQYNWCITTDFTTTGGTSNDFSGIAVWAISSNHDFLLCDLILKKQDIAYQYNDLFRMVEKYSRFIGSMPVGIEIDGQQKIHLFALKQLMSKRNTYFTMANQKGKVTEGILSRSVKGSKEDRFAATVPMFQNGKIWISKHLYNTPDYKELMQEIKYATYDDVGKVSFNSKHDDGLDLISMLVSMETYPASPVVSVETFDDPMWDDVVRNNDKSRLNSYIV